MKALIIGANGYIGRHLAFYLQKAKFNISCSDRQTTTPHNNYPYQAVNIAVQEEVESLSLDVDYIFMLAGLNGTAVGFQKYNDFIQVNEIGLLHVLNRIKETQSKAQLIYLSSRLVYEGQKDVFLKEEAIQGGNSIYAINKIACERYLKLYQKCFDIPYTIFRLCVPYGNVLDEKYSYGTIGFMLSKVMSGEAISLYGDGSQKRTFTHVEDVCALLIASCQQPNMQNQTFNIGGPNNISLLELANLIADVLGAKVAHTDWPALAHRMESGDTIFDGTKLLQATHYNYQHNLKDWLYDLAKKIKQA